MNWTKTDGSKWKSRRQFPYPQAPLAPRRKSATVADNDSDDDISSFLISNDADSTGFFSDTVNRALITNQTPYGSRHQHLTPGPQTPAIRPSRGHDRMDDARMEERRERSDGREKRRDSDGRSWNGRRRRSSSSSSSTSQTPIRSSAGAGLSSSSSKRTNSNPSLISPPRPHSHSFIPRFTHPIVSNGLHATRQSSNPSIQRSAQSVTHSNENEEVRFVLEGPGAKAPELIYPGYDLFAAVTVEIPGGGYQLVSTGVKLILPPRTFAVIHSRVESQLTKQKIILASAAAVISEDSKEPIRILLHNLKGSPSVVVCGQPIALLIFHQASSIS